MELNTDVKQQIERYYADKKDQFVEHIRKLVEIPSVKGAASKQYPFGEAPALALQETLRIAEELGLTTHNFENYVGTISINSCKTQLGILGHVDVVGEGSGWTYPPFAGEVVDGKMYGRGTSDDKGPVIAALYALAAVKELGIPLQYNTKLIVGTDEESGCEDIEYYFTKEKAPPYVFTPDAEFPVINIEKGAIRTAFTAQYELEDKLPRIVSLYGGYKVNVVPPEATAIIEGLSTKQIEEIAAKVTEATGAEFILSSAEGDVVTIQAVGVGAHASIPETGVNAITALLTLIISLPLADTEGQRLLQGVSRIFPHGDHEAKAAGLAMSDELSGALTMNLAIIEYKQGKFKGQFDSRIPLCATEENTFGVLEQTFAPYHIQLERAGYEAPHHTPEDSPFVQTLLAVYEQYTGKHGECIATGGGTYVHNIEGGVAYGPAMPGVDTRMHSNDEHIIIEDMLLASQIYAQVIVELCGSEQNNL